jgi:hypothetical protein
MTYKIFICHAYDHQDIYEELRKKLNDRIPKFDWRNLSVQYDMRYGTVDNEIDQGELRELIGKRIEDCDVLLALTKPIASRREWLQWEINRANDLGKPVIGIARRKNDSVSRFVRANTDDIVDTWRVDHIINAIEFQVSEYRARPAQVLPNKADLPPLPVNPPDEEVAPDPTPEAPDEAATAPISVTNERKTTQAGPRDVLFKDPLGSFVPGAAPLNLRDRRQPKWWWPFDGKDR